MIPRWSGRTRSDRYWVIAIMDRCSVRGRRSGLRSVIRVIRLIQRRAGIEIVVTCAIIPRKCVRGRLRLIRSTVMSGCGIRFDLMRWSSLIR